MKPTEKNKQDLASLKIFPKIMSRNAIKLLQTYLNQMKLKFKEDIHQNILSIQKNYPFPIFVKNKTNIKKNLPWKIFKKVL